MSCEEKQTENQETIHNPIVEQIAVRGASIYHYMKNHPGSFAALISAIVAIISFVLHAALYRRTSAYLRFWGFNADNVNIENGNQIYVVALAFVFCLAMGGLTYFLCQTFHVFQKRANVLLYLRIDNKYTLREILKLRIGMVVVSVGAWFYKKRGASQKQIDEIKENVADQQSRLDELTTRIKARQKTLWHLRRSNAIMLLPSLLIAYGLLLLLIGLTGVAHELRAVMPYPELVLSIFVLILICFVYCLVRFEFRKERRKIKKAFKKDYESAYKMIEELADQDKEQYPMMQMIKSNAGELFTNKAIAFSAFSTADDNTTSKKTTFSVVNVEGQDYVITYTCDTTYYLNEARINAEENTIIVSKERQRVIVSDDIRYSVVQFTSVQIESGQE